MEDALVHLVKRGLVKEATVLILVLMEDALVLVSLKQRFGVSHSSLNPCFNGRCTRTKVNPIKKTLKRGLNPCFNGRCTRT